MTCILIQLQVSRGAIEREGRVARVGDNRGRVVADGAGVITRFECGISLEDRKLIIRPRG